MDVAADAQTLAAALGYTAPAAVGAGSAVLGGALFTLTVRAARRHLVEAHGRPNAVEHTGLYVSVESSE